MSDRLTIRSRSGRVFEIVNYWQVLLVKGVLTKISVDRSDMISGVFSGYQKFLDGTSPRIYPWNQSKIENRKSSSPRIDPWGQSKIENPKSKIQNPQAPELIRGVNRKSKIENRKSIDCFLMTISCNLGLFKIYEEFTRLDQLLCI
jgi:hypothetical protein